MAEIAAAALKDDATGHSEAIPVWRRLSTKLLLLTILFVMIAEVLIFPPSIARFRLQWLEQRLGTAAAVSLVVMQTDRAAVGDGGQQEVLRAINAIAVAVRDAGESRLMMVTDVPPEIDAHVDLDTVGPLEAMRGAFSTLIFGGDQTIRVSGHVGDSAKEFELILPDSALRAAMVTYAVNIALLSLLISVITAGFVFFAILQMLVRPIGKLRASMLRFAEHPEDPANILEPSRADELGSAENELARMQRQLQRTLGEQKHLADLGLAVSKINHDMRNILATAQLVSDRLDSVQDPAVQAFAPTLVRALDRAVSYSENVLAYGRAQEPPPARRRLRLRQLVDEVAELLAIEPASGVDFVNDVDAGLEIDADADQLFRILTNLSRNALQAMSTDTTASIVRRLTIAAQRIGTVCRIEVTDTGPGLPEKARQNLFTAFRGSARSGGTGLGLAIAQELARAHGGRIELVESVGGHTVFSVTIPDQPVSLERVRQTVRRNAQG